MQRPQWRRSLLAALAAVAGLIFLVTASPTAAQTDCTTECFVAPTGSDSNHGTSPADAFLTIQKAVDTVAAGGTVHVAAGNYAPATVSRSVTLLGAKAGEDARHLIPGAGQSTLPLANGATGLTISGTGIDVTIDGFSFLGSGGVFGTAILTAAGLTGTLTVDNNLFQNLIRGIDASLGTATLSATHNKMVAISGGTARAFSIGSVGNGAPATITENVVNGGVLGIDVVLSGGAAGSVITGNVFRPDSSTLATGISIGSGLSGTGTVINRNTFANHLLGGISNSSTSDIDATCNWWGQVNGPAPGGSGDGIVGAQAAHVLRQPWLVNNSLATAPCTGMPGQFPGDCTTDCYVNAATGDDGNTGASPAEPMKTLGAATLQVQAGGNVHVAPGLYDANFTDVTKSMNLLGAQAGNDPTAPGSARVPGDLATESVIRSNSGLRIMGPQAFVTVDGFTFQQKTAGQSFAITAGVSGQDVGAFLTIKNNIFEMGTSGGISSTNGTNPSTTMHVLQNHFLSGRTGVAATGGGTATLNVHDNVFEDLTTAAFQANQWTGAQFRDNVVDGVGGQGTALALGACMSCVVEDNTITNYKGASAINIFAFNTLPSRNVRIAKNTISNPDDANAIAISVTQADGTAITENTITGVTKGGVEVLSVANNTTIADNAISGTGGYGVQSRVFTFIQPQGAGITITGNDISGLAKGVRLEYPATVRENTITSSAEVGVEVLATAGTPATHINRNQLTGNAAGLTSSTANPVDATCNWWGAAGGPSGEGPGSGDSVSANATYHPWLSAPGTPNPCHRDVHQCDGAVDALDVQAVLNILVGLGTAPQPTAPCDGDVNFDAQVDLADAIVMSRVAAGLPAD